MFIHLIIFIAFQGKNFRLFLLQIFFLNKISSLFSFFQLLHLARIVGGAVANPFSHPWQVRVRACSGHACTRMCGGTLVSSRHVVTASHCIPPYGQTGIITLGAHEYFGPEARNVSVETITQHPG